MTDMNPILDPNADNVTPPDLIRAAADGELTPAQRDRFESLRAAGPKAVEHQLAFESALRQAVGRAMSAPEQAPDSLRAAIMSMFAAEQTDAVASIRVNTEGVRQVRTQGSAGSSSARALRRPAFWTSRSTWMSVAASIALLTAVSVIVKSPIGSRLGPAISAPLAAELVAASSFIISEHDKCSAFDSYFEHKFNVREEADASDAVVELLGQPPTRIKLDQAGYQFIGLGKCTVPGPGDSVHMLYRPVNESRPTLSLFVQQDSARQDLESGIRYRLTTKAGAPVLVWRADGLIYYLFSPDAQAELDAGELLSIPDQQRDI